MVLCLLYYFAYTYFCLLIACRCLSLIYFCLFLVVLCLCHYWCLFVDPLCICVLFVSLWSVFVLVVVCVYLWYLASPVVLSFLFDVDLKMRPGVSQVSWLGFPPGTPASYHSCVCLVWMQRMKHFRTQNKKMCEKCFEWSVRKASDEVICDVFSLCKSETLDSSLRGFISTSCFVSLAALHLLFHWCMFIINMV